MLERRHRIVAKGAVVALAVVLAVGSLHASTAVWTDSDLDSWVYNNASQPGAATASPTWLNELTINPTTHQFDPMPSTNPARLGMALFAFNSVGKISTGLAANRYQINSITFKATCEFAGLVPAQYETAPVTQPQILNEFATGNMSWQKPMELYGVRFRAGYTGFEFTASPPGPPLYDEITHAYSGTGSYVLYPIVGSNSTPGAYVDVSNSVSGGFSATEPSNTTAAFTATPWAIGTTNLSVGDEIPNNTTFTFTLDLNAPGVRSYVQQSLSSGALGLIVSTLHATTTLGGSGVYPRWYTKEAGSGIIPVPPSSLPQLTIDYEILPAGVPGDYNGNGVVDAADYVVWRNGGPLQNEIATPGSITSEDYTEWRARFGNTAGAASSLQGDVVPEPISVGLTMIGTLCLIARLRARRFQG